MNPYTQNVVNQIAEQGVRLNPITENELKLLLSTSPQLTNRPEANVRILNDRIAQIDRTIQKLRDQLATLDNGGNITDYRPGQVPASAPQVSAPPAAGGPGSVSTIPTIRKQ
jgi:hypothetical protein